MAYFDRYEDYEIPVKEEFRYTTVEAKDEDDLLLQFGLIQDKTGLMPSVDKGLMVFGDIVFADPRAARKRVEAAFRNEREDMGGKAVALRITQPCPRTGRRFDPRTGQLRKVWLIAARG